MRQLITFVVLFAFSFLSIHGNHFPLTSAEAREFNLDEEPADEFGDTDSKSEDKKEEKKEDENPFGDEEKKSDSTSSSDTGDDFGTDSKKEASDETPVATPAVKAKPKDAKKIAVLHIFSDSIGMDKAKDQTRAITAIIDKNDKYNLTETEAKVFSGWYSAESAAKKIDDLFNAGKKLYDDAELEDAAKKFEAAVSVGIEHLDAMVDYTTLSKMLFFTGAAYAMDDQNDKARPFLREYLFLNPDSEPFDTTLSDDVNDFFNTVKSGLVMLPVGDALFTSEPSGALVWLDGKLLGTTPVKAEGLLEGRHFYRMHKLGYGDTGGTVTIRDGRESKVDDQLSAAIDYANFADTEKKIISSWDTTDMMHYSVELGTKMSVDRFLVVYTVLEGDSITTKLRIFNPSKKTYKEDSLSVVLPANGDFSKVDELGPAIDGLIADDFGYGPISTLGSGIAGKDSAKKNDDDSVVTKWWFWTAIVGGLAAAAGIATGTYFAVSGSSKSDPGATLEINFGK